MASSDEEWLMLDSDNPADSSDDDCGVLSLHSSYSTSPACSVDDDAAAADDDAAAADDEDEDVEIEEVDMEEDPYDIPEEDDDDDAAADEDEGIEIEDPYDIPEEDDDDRPLPPKPLAGLFHNTLSDSAAYAPFDALRSAKQLIPDPAFSLFPEKVTVLASTRGLVCLRGDKSDFYYVANPVTFKRVRLPNPTCDHAAKGDPAVVITFDDDDHHHHQLQQQRPRAAADAFHHYHVVVVFQVDAGICAFESFSSRTWNWRVGGEICAPETVVAASGVGALGRAFWRTTIDHILCYTPGTGRVDLIPAPQEVESRPLWEIGEMEGSFCVTCMDEPVTEVAVLYLEPDHRAGEVSWAWAGHFEGGKMRGRQGVTLLRSQGAAEVVMWDPRAELVLVMDFDGRATRTIGPLSAVGEYIADFIPYVSSDTEIYSDEVGYVFKTNDDVTLIVPNPSAR